MNIFQRVYDWMDGWKAPDWMKIILQQLNDLMVAMLKQVTLRYVNFLKAEIIHAARQNWTSEEKFNYVFKKAKEGFLEFSITIKDSELNLLIEYFVNLLKVNGAIK